VGPFFDQGGGRAATRSGWAGRPERAGRAPVTVRPVRSGHPRRTVHPQRLDRHEGPRRRQFTSRHRLRTGVCGISGHREVAGCGRRRRVPGGLGPCSYSIPNGRIRPRRTCSHRRGDRGGARILPRAGAPLLSLRAIGDSAQAGQVWSGPAARAPGALKCVRWRRSPSANEGVSRRGVAQAAYAAWSFRVVNIPRILAQCRP
jgi:hypothetical protein